MTSRLRHGLLAVLVCGLLLPALVRADDAKKSDAAGVVPVFTLQGALSEQPMADDMLFASAGDSLKDLVKRLKQAREDDRVKGVVLLLNGPAYGMAQMEELRAVFQQLKEADKPVHCHVHEISMQNYVLLSGASTISIVPTGDVWLTGLYSESLHVRGLLDLLGVQPDFLTCGAYKSAAEMFTHHEPSAAAAENLNWLLDGMHENYVNLIAEGRGVSREKVEEWIGEGLFSAERAEKAGIVDKVQHRHDFEQELREQHGEQLKFDRRYGKQKATDIDFSTPFGLLKFYADLLGGPKKSAAGKAAIAVVYVEGPIMAGEQAPGGFPLTSASAAFSHPIRKALEEAARDENIKGVVLRVNSPGGSAVGSEIILQATQLVKKHKPIVVSMGDVAGSGGYYVACGVDTIFADASTLTGSIGVVGGKLATKQMWDKVGVNFVPFQRGEKAGMLNSGRPFTDAERQQLQTWMDEVYDVFKKHVVEARGDRLKKEIDELAGGRVYTGKQALELGLVDQLGGLEEAIAHVAEKAELEEYDVRALPQPKNFLELLLGDAANQKADEKHLSLEYLNARQNASLLHAALPHLRSLDPRRVELLLQALQQLEIARSEQVMLTMPVFRITSGTP